MKKVALVFLAFVNVLNIAAAVYVQVVQLMKYDFLSVITVDSLTTYEQLYINMIAFSGICALISVVVAALANSEKKFSELKLFVGVPKVFVVLEIVIFGFCVYNALSLGTIEMIACIGIMLVHILTECLCGGSMKACFAKKEVAEEA